VHEQTGVIVQVTEHGYAGMLCLAAKSNKLYFLRPQLLDAPAAVTGAEPATGAAPTAKDARGPSQIIEVDLDRLFADSAAGTVQAAEVYERVCGTIPLSWGAGGDMALDADEQVAFFRVGPEEAAKHLPADVKVEANYGPRNMGAGPNGLGRMDLRSGEVSFVVAVPFQIGHVQTNPWVPGEIVFCWETGGKSPQRTWTVRGDGTGLRPLYPEADYEWVTHEAIITPDEVAIAIMGHRDPDLTDAWGKGGSREKPTGLGIVNLRTRAMRIAGQTKSGSGLWHVHGSPDGRWAVGDDFARSLYLIDRTNDEMILLSAGHKASAADHPHPTFSPDGTRIQIQSAMISEDGRAMNICIIPVPENLLKRTYPAPAPAVLAKP
jgi:oligogalacturonide lyase